MVILSSPSDTVELTAVKGYGAFTIAVEDAQWPGSGAAALFNVCANTNSVDIKRTATVTGIDGEQVVVYWQTGSRPTLGFLNHINAEYLPKKYLVHVGHLSTEPAVKPWNRT